MLETAQDGNMIKWLHDHPPGRGRWACFCGAYGETPSPEVFDHYDEHKAQCTTVFVASKALDNQGTMSAATRMPR